MINATLLSWTVQRQESWEATLSLHAMRDQHASSVIHELGSQAFCIPVCDVAKL